MTSNNDDTDSYAEPGTPAKAERSSLPSEISALIHHVELNRAGWWDKAVQRLALSVVWLSVQPPTTAEILTTLRQDYSLTLSDAKLRAALTALEAQNLLVRGANSSYRIPDSVRRDLDAEIRDTERVEASVRGLFCQLSDEHCPGLVADQVWDAFDSAFLRPFVKELGANAYNLITGNRPRVHHRVVRDFLVKFDPAHHRGLRRAVFDFLDPKNSEVREYVSRMLHAHFCVEAAGLSAAVIHRLQSTVARHAEFRLFVDTNFLFSILDLHENPSNAAAGELLELVSKLTVSPTVKLYIVPRTIDEAKGVIAAAKYALSGIPASEMFTNVALHVGMSGMYERFFTERQRRDGKLNADDWFDPYLDDFVTIARGKGVEVFQTNLDPLALRQDVLDDALQVQGFEEKRYQEHQRKSYKAVIHDMILWHFVSDHRPRPTESPTDARDWILTVDFRLIAFDAFKQRTTGGKIPVCLHPTSLVQLLRFWVPRTAEFEEAMLGTMRLPFLFRPFDVEAERTTLRILKGLGRFEGRDDLSEKTITSIVLNEHLRSQLSSDLTSADNEVALIRDALVAEMKLRADAEAARATELEGTVRQKDDTLGLLEADKQRIDREIASLTKTVAEQRAELADMRASAAVAADAEATRRALLGYCALLAMVVAVTVFAASQTSRVLPGLSRASGVIPAGVLVSVCVFGCCHMFLELCVGSTARMSRLWPFRRVRRFRKWLWAVVIGSFVLGVVGNLYANYIQRNMQQKPGPPLRSVDTEVEKK